MHLTFIKWNTYNKRIWETPDVALLEVRAYPSFWLLLVIHIVQKAGNTRNAKTNKNFDCRVRRWKSWVDFPGSSSYEKGEWNAAGDYYAALWVSVVRAGVAWRPPSLLLLLRPSTLPCSSTPVFLLFFQCASPLSVSSSAVCLCFDPQPLPRSLTEHCHKTLDL